MEPGHFAIASWIPKINTGEFPDTLTIYDAGNIQGFFLKEATGKTTWIVFQVDYRLLQEDGTILEGRTILPHTSAPLEFYSRETYPMMLQSKGVTQKVLTLPQTQILLSLSEVPLFSPLAEASLPPERPLLPQQSPLPRARHGGPGQRVSQKSDSRKPTGGQRLSQNKSTSSAMLTGRPSSNRENHAQPLSQVPRTQAAHPQLSPPEHHTGHESSESLPWLSLAQQSLFSRPPPELEGEHVAQA